MLLLLLENKSWHRGWKRQRWTMAAICALRFTKDHKRNLLFSCKIILSKWIYCLHTAKNKGFCRGRVKNSKAGKAKSSNNCNYNYKYPLPWGCQVNQAPFHGLAALSKGLRHQNWVRASLDLAFWLKLSEKQDWCASIPGSAQKFSPAFLSDPGAGSFHSPNSPLSSLCLIHHCRASVQGSPLGDFTARKGRVCVFSDCCSLCPHQNQDPRQQLNSKTISLLLWISVTPTCSSPELQRLWVKTFQMCCSSGEGSPDTGGTIQDTQHHCHADFGGNVPQITGDHNGTGVTASPIIPSRYKLRWTLKCTDIQLSNPKITDIQLSNP